MLLFTKDYSSDKICIVLIKCHDNEKLLIIQKQETYTISFGNTLFPPKKIIIIIIIKNNKENES